MFYTDNLLLWLSVPEEHSWRSKTRTLVWHFRKKTLLGRIDGETLGGVKEQSNHRKMTFSIHHYISWSLLSWCLQHECSDTCCEHVRRAALCSCRSHQTALVMRWLFWLGLFPQDCSGPCSALGPFVDEQFEALEPCSAHGRVLLVLLPLLLWTWEDSVCAYLNLDLLRFWPTGNYPQC